MLQESVAVYHVPELPIPVLGWIPGLGMVPQSQQEVTANMRKSRYVCYSSTQQPVTPGLHQAHLVY